MIGRVVLVKDFLLIFGYCIEFVLFNDFCNVGIRVGIVFRLFGRYGCVIGSEICDGVILIELLF